MKSILSSTLFILILATTAFDVVANASEPSTSTSRNEIFVADAADFPSDGQKTPFGKIDLVDRSTNDANVDGSDACKKSFHCDVVKKPNNPWDFSLQFRVGRPVVKGEVLLLEFDARTLSAQTESGLAVVRAFFQSSAPPFAKSLDRRVEIGREFRKYSIPFRCAESREANESSVGFFLGDILQTLEISNVVVSSFGTNFDISTLSDSVPRYPGQESDAPWRQAAEERIERFRKAPLTIRTFDGEGNPLPNVSVEIRETRSEFRWGTAVVANRLLQRDADGDKYREFVANYCNVVVFENDLKWFAWQNRRNRDAVFQATNWLDEKKIALRGHCLVWPSWRNSNPGWRTLANNPDELRDAVREHIRDEASTLRGRTLDWDVVNEIHDNNDLLKILGRETALIDWFQTARDAHPNARLFINDYGILSGEGLDVRKQDSYFETIKKLLDAGAPIGGIGMQGHFGETATPPERIVEILDRFASLGLPIAITEHDVDANDETYRVEFTRDFLTAAFSSPAVDEILVWGFWEKSHWRPNAAYFSADWTPTSMGRVWLDLVGKKWRSNLDETTNENGASETRVFRGDYRIVVRVGEKSRSEEVVVSKDGANVEFHFD